MAGDRANVEAAMNHVHLIDLFSSSEYQPNRALLLRLGQIMKEMWSCKLAQDFRKSTLKSVSHRIVKTWPVLS